MPDCCLSQ